MVRPVYRFSDLCQETNTHQWGPWRPYDKFIGIDKDHPYRYWSECERLGCNAIRKTENLVPQGAYCEDTER